MTLPLSQLMPEEIERLDANGLVQLLHRLLHCEARHHQIKTPGIFVPFQINVPDGGRDGRWNADIGVHEFIPRAVTYYQCKAEHLIDSDFEKEVAPEKKDKAGNVSYLVKDRVREVLSQGGCYVFFSSKQEIKPSESKDADKVVRARLKLAGFDPHTDAKIEFLGCNRIADWANRFPSAIRFVREKIHHVGGVHFHTMESWQKQISPDGAYFSNETLRTKITAIRSTLSEGKSRVLRLTGLSGLGKTRLVFEALKADAKDTPVVNALEAAAIYLSYEDVRGDLINFINHLATGDYSALIVVDDCPPEIHDRIARIVSPSALSVITIFHEPQEIRQDTQALTIDAETLRDVVENILRQSPLLLAQGEEAIKAVAAFAEGFPQIAKLLVAFRRAPSMHELADRAGLFRKLLSWGEQPDDPTLSTVQSLALFRSIGGSAQKLEADLEIIRTTFCPNISALDFRRVIDGQKRRRIIQQTADTLIVAPRPLAVALTAGFLPVCPGNWKDHLATLKKANLASEFVRRVEELEISDKSEELGRLFLEEKLPFNDAEYLLTGKTVSHVFRALTVLNPSSACKIAKKTIGHASLDRLSQVKDSRRNLVRSLEIMVWSRDTFFSAAPLLLKLAAAENEAWANNATGEFSQLFRLSLSGTKVPAIDRLSIIRDALDSQEPRFRQIAIHALGSGLQDGGYTRMNDATLGGKRNAREDWRPSTQNEVTGYWRECYLILQDVITSNSPESDLAKGIMAQHSHGILRSRLLLELESNFKQLAGHLKGLWPEMKTAIRHMLEIHEELPAEHRAALERWRDYLTPPTVAIAERLRDIVIKPGWHHRKELDGKFTDLSKLDAEKLAAELAQTGFDLRPHLAPLLLGEQQQSFAFGATLARTHLAAPLLIEEALKIWPTLEPREKRNDFLIRGLIHGISDQGYQTTILDRIVADAKLIELLIPITSALPTVTELDFLRIRAAVEQNAVPAPLLHGLIPGAPLLSLSDAFIKVQFEQIARNKKETVAVLFQVLFLHCHGDAAKFAFFADTFRQFLLTPGLPIMETHFGWEWEETAKRLVSTSTDEKWFAALSQYIVNILREEETFVRTDSLRKVVVDLLRKAPAVVWPIFGDALSGKDEMLRFVLKEFLGGSGHGFDDHSEDCPIWQIPLPQFRAWVDAHLELIPTLLDRTQLYTVSKDETGTERFNWHPHALMLIERADDESVVLDEVFGNLYSFGSTGSRIPYWERRLDLAGQLTASPSARLRRLGLKLSDQISEVIEQTRREEMNEQARFS